MADELEQHPVMFELHNSGVITNVLFSDHEQAWCSNIKRGLISLFQFQPPQNVSFYFKKNY